MLLPLLSFLDDLSQRQFAVPYFEKTVGISNLTDVSFEVSGPPHEKCELYFDEGMAVRATFWFFIWSTMYIVFNRILSTFSFYPPAQPVLVKDGKKVKEIFTRPELCSRVVSIFHCVMCLYSAGTVFFTHADGMSIPVTGSSPLAITQIEVTLGFFLYDLVLILYFNKQFNMMKETVFHHFLGIASLLIVFFSHCGDQLLSIWLLTELSTIFLNIRYALYHTGHDSSLLYIVNGLLLTITFVGVRISLSIFTIVRVFIMARADFVHLPLFMTVFIVSVNLSLTVLNINWSIKLVKGAMKVLRKGTKKDKKE